MSNHPRRRGRPSAAAKASASQRTHRRDPAPTETGSRGQEGRRVDVLYEGRVVGSAIHVPDPAGLSPGTLLDSRITDPDLAILLARGEKLSLTADITPPKPNEGS